MQIMKYYKSWKCRNDLVTGESAGDIFSAVTIRGELMYKSRIGTKLPIEKMTHKFFYPIGEAIELYPPFPSLQELQDEYYYLIGEPRLVDTVNFIRAANPIFYSDEFTQKVYELFKQMYNDKYHSA